jgi:hypothetical protein
MSRPFRVFFRLQTDMDGKDRHGPLVGSMTQNKAYRITRGFSEGLCDEARGGA